MTEALAHGLLVSAARSGAGKTVVTVGLHRAPARMRMRVEGFFTSSREARKTD